VTGLGLGWLAAAWGHGGVDRTVHVDRLHGTWEVTGPSAGVLSALGIGADDVPSHEAAIARWLVDGLELSVGGVACASGPPRLSTGAQVSVARTFTCPEGPVSVRDGTIEQTSAGEQTLVVADADAILLTGAHSSATLIERPGMARTAARFVVEGATHLITGFDHVLFLLCLLFVTGPTARRLGGDVALRQLAGITTAFTVGHSVTLVAAALGWVVLPSRWVEVTIALSIVVAAALNVARPAGGGPRGGMALVFGLVHGFGFSSVLAETGLPAGSRVLALLAFNVGIELAQLAVVGVAIGPLAWLAAHPLMYRRWVMRAGSAGIGFVATVWMIERLLGA
jgi:HupE / UreJ protein